MTMKWTLRKYLATKAAAANATMTANATWGREGWPFTDDSWASEIFTSWARIPIRKSAITTDATMAIECDKYLFSLALCFFCAIGGTAEDLMYFAAVRTPRKPADTTVSQ